MKNACMRKAIFVKQGQLLFQLERDQYEAKVQQAQAQFNNAEREWKRIRPLYEKNAVSQKERDNARAAYESAKAELRQARINLDYCQVTAPVSGYSSKENFTPGNLVGNNSLLTYVNQTDPMYIDFSIAAPERMRRQQLAAAGRLRFPDDGHYKAQLRLLDGSMYKGEGEVTFIDSQVQPSTGVIKARAVFANADGHIMPGQYVRLFMEGDVLTNAVLIPQKCVLLTQKGALVMALDKDNKVFPVPGHPQRGRGRPLLGGFRPQGRREDHQRGAGQGPARNPGARAGTRRPTAAGSDSRRSKVGTYGRFR